MNKDEKFGPFCSWYILWSTLWILIMLLILILACFLYDAFGKKIYKSIHYLRKFMIRSLLKFYRVDQTRWIWGLGVFCRKNLSSKWRPQIRSKIALILGILVVPKEKTWQRSWLKSKRDSSLYSSSFSSNLKVKFWWQVRDTSNHKFYPEGLKYLNLSPP